MVHVSSRGEVGPQRSRAAAWLDVSQGLSCDYSPRLGDVSPTLVYGANERRLTSFSGLHIYLKMIYIFGWLNKYKKGEWWFYSIRKQKGYGGVVSDSKWRIAFVLYRERRKGWWVVFREAAPTPTWKVHTWCRVAGDRRVGSSRVILSAVFTRLGTHLPVTPDTPLHLIHIFCLNCFHSITLPGPLDPLSYPSRISFSFFPPFFIFLTWMMSKTFNSPQTHNLTFFYLL